MPTSTEQINDLIAASTALKQYFESAQNDIEARVVEALQTVPSVSKTYHVDAVEGLDTNTGSSESPLQTITEAINRAPETGSLTLFLKSDIVMPAARINLDGVFLRLVGGGAPGGRAKITFAAFEDASYSYISGWNVSGAGTGIAFNDCHLVFPSSVGITRPGHGRQVCILGSITTINRSDVFFGLSGCDLEFPVANGFGYCATLSQNIVNFLTFDLTDLNGTMSGRYVKDAGADPQATPGLTTNMITI